MTKCPCPDGSYERALFDAGNETIAGIDEVGRGAWAGPLAVGVVVLTKALLASMPAGVRDSKQLTALARMRLYSPLAQNVTAYAIGFASSDECDTLGMTAAQEIAARRALDGLRISPDAIIVDGPRDFTKRREAITLVRGDQRSLVVAAASILAKVTRDRLMVALAATYPPYGFERNKGYASVEHRQAVMDFGLTSIHRKSWSVAALASRGDA
jgi:ribonuclease HII